MSSDGGERGQCPTSAPITTAKGHSMTDRGRSTPAAIGPSVIDLHSVAPAGDPAPEAPRRTLAEDHTADTRRVLIEAATELFAAKGYEATSTPEIMEAARVSRGAIYHHFESKAGLFAAVLEAVETDFIDRRAAAGAPGHDVWDQITNRA